MAQQQHKYFEVKLVRSGLGRQQSQRKTLEGLGLTRVGRVRYFKDTPPIRGMLYKVGYLLQVTARAGEKPPSARDKARPRRGDR
ncbi:MAG: 50S ribosomal protein L30 [Deltaproteobacteria bacterium]|nr:MAG: 50S ribosomal protein L30 [Deltaproteobacteria bacterium]